MLDFPSLLYKGPRILMFQLSGVYCRSPDPRPSARSAMDPQASYCDSSSTASPNSNPKVVSCSSRSLQMCSPYSHGLGMRVYLDLPYYKP